jgi:glycosyltransferase involved in cell wall biosynthesis
MACARPVIASAVGGIVDVISDGVDGFLVPPRDAHVLTTAIHRLLDMPHDRLRAGLRARCTVQTRFSLDLELNSNLETYSRLLRPPSP